MFKTARQEELTGIQKQKANKQTKTSQLSLGTKMKSRIPLPWDRGENLHFFQINVRVPFPSQDGFLALPAKRGIRVKFPMRHPATLYAINQ